MPALLRRPRRALAVVPAALVVLLATGCRDRHFDEVVRGALYCQACVAGEIGALVAYGDRAVPRLRNELHGPTPGDSAAHQRMITAQWSIIRARRAHSAPAVLTADSTRLARQSAMALLTFQQVRVLFLLDRIGTPAARQAIRDAFRNDSAGVVRLTVDARLLADSLRHR